MAKKLSWARTGQRALGGLLTSSAAEKEVGCARCPLALAASGELGAHAKLALLMLRSIPLQGTTPDRARRRTSGSLCGYPFCYESHARVRTLACGGRTATRSDGAAPAQECSCGLNGFLPSLCLGSLHLNPRPPKDFGALALSPLLPPWQTETRASVFDRKIALWELIFLPKRNPKIPGGKGRTRANTAQSRLCAMTTVKLKNNTNWI